MKPQDWKREYDYLKSWKADGSASPSQLSRLAVLHAEGIRRSKIQKKQWAAEDAAEKASKARKPKAAGDPKAPKEGHTPLDTAKPRLHPEDPDEGLRVRSKTTEELLTASEARLKKMQQVLGARSTGATLAGPAARMRGGGPTEDFDKAVRQHLNVNKWSLKEMNKWAKAKAPNISPLKNSTAAAAAIAEIMRTQKLQLPILREPEKGKEVDRKKGLSLSEKLDLLAADKPLPDPLAGLSLEAIKGFLATVMDKGRRFYPDDDLAEYSEEDIRAEATDQLKQGNITLKKKATPAAPHHPTLASGPGPTVREATAPGRRIGRVTTRECGTQCSLEKKRRRRRSVQWKCCRWRNGGD